jgi:WD40 repeat protein
MATFMRRFCTIVVAVFAVAVVGSAPADEPEAPKAAELKEAVDTLKDAFEKDYRAAETDAKAKRTLARKLFDGAPKRKTVAMQYASYDEARRLAATGGDTKLAVEAVAALAKFRNAPPDLATDTFKLLAVADLSPESATDLLALATDATDAALAREDFPGAVALGQLLVGAAKKVEDPDVLIDARKLLARLEALASATAVIKTKPDDPAANEALGRYWAFTRGRWEIGLKHLVKSSNKELATVAKDDLRNPLAGAGRTAIADAWYKLAKSHTGAEHRGLIDRAWLWYAAAASTGDGEAAKRAAEIEKKYPDLFSQTFRGHTEGAAGIAVTPNGNTLVSISNDKTVRLWDGATGKLVKTLEGHTGWVGSIVLTPDGTRAITAGGNSKGGAEPPCEIIVWDLKTQAEAMRLEGHTVSVRGLALTGDGKTLISGGGDRTCRAWDLTTGKETKRYGGEKDAIESVAVTPDGKFVLIGTEVGVITVHDAKTGEVVSTFDKHAGGIVFAIVTTNDGKTALSGAREKDFRAWDIATGKELKVFTGHGDQVYQVALSRDGKFVVSASADATVRVWDFKSGKELKKFTGHATSAVQGACFSPEGRFVYSASWDKTVRKWRLPLVPAPKVD